MEVILYVVKIKSVWICSECGYESLKWNGQCPACGEWNTFSEEIKDTSKQTTMSYQKSGVYEKPILLNQIKMMMKADIKPD